MPASKVLQVASEVRARRARGLEVLDVAMGDLGQAQRPPAELVRGCTRALAAGDCRYPPPAGREELRHLVAALYQRELGLAVSSDSVLVQGGARPLLFAAFAALVAPGEVVLDPVPSWNNDAYAALVGARRIELPTEARDGFLVQASALEPHLPRARLLILCSPSNPAGTMFDERTLAPICALVREENQRRARLGERPLHLLWDQVYWQTVTDLRRYLHPLALAPDLAPYVVTIDGASKAFAATGLRVGWAVAPPALRASMLELLDHVGAWAPTPMQVGVAELLADPIALGRYRQALAADLAHRRALVTAQLRALQPPVEVLDTDGGLYVAARLALPAESDEAARRRLLDRGGVAAIPFGAFGVSRDSGWFRIAVAGPGEDELATLGARIQRSLVVR
jgi:aspartate aminotransferase